MADACAEVAIAAAAMLNGAPAAGPDASGDDAEAGAVGVGDVMATATATAVGSGDVFGDVVVAASASVTSPEPDLMELSATFPALSCFDDFAVAGRALTSAAEGSSLRRGSDGVAGRSVAVSAAGSRSCRGVRGEAARESRRSVAAERGGSSVVCAPASTNAAKPCGSEPVSGADVRGGSGLKEDVALDSDVTLNKGTSTHESQMSPARNRPIEVAQKILINQIYIWWETLRAEAMRRTFLPGGKICRQSSATA